MNLNWTSLTLYSSVSGTSLKRQFQNTIFSTGTTDQYIPPMNNQGHKFFKSSRPSILFNQLLEKKPIFINLSKVTFFYKQRVMTGWVREMTFFPSNLIHDENDSSDETSHHGKWINKDGEIKVIKQSDENEHLGLDLGDWDKKSCCHQYW